MTIPSSTGTYNNFLTGADLVLEAFSRIQLRGTAITSEHMSDARLSCILMNSALMNRGLNLWTVTLGSLPLTAGTATYTLAPDVLFMLDAYIEIDVNGTPQDTYLYQLSRTDYAAIPDKTQQGKPTQLWFDRLTTPTITFYLVPDDNGPYTVKYYYQRQLQDVGMTMGKTIDAPFRMLDAFASELAYRLARKYRPEAAGVLKAEAAQSWVEAASSDRENVPLTIMPQMGTWYRRR